LNKPILLIIIVTLIGSSYQAVGHSSTTNLIEGLVIQYPSISPNGDGTQDSSRVDFTFGAPCDSLVITLEDSIGTQTFDSLLFIQNADSGETGLCYWTGKDSLNQILAEGTYRLHLFASNIDTSEHITKYLFLDITSPTVELTRIEPGIYAPGTEGSADSVKLYISVTDWQSNDNFTLEIVTPSGQSDAIDANITGDGEYVLKWGGDQTLQDGIHNVLVEVNDDAGNRDSDEGNINVDTDNPLIGFYHPLSGEVNQVAYIIEGYCYDRNGIDESTLTIIWNESSTLSPDSTYISSDTLIWSINIEDSISADGEYLEGQYSMGIECDDVFGRESSEEMSFQIDTTPPPPPSISAPSEARNDPEVTTTVTVSSLDDTYTIEIYRYSGADTVMAETMKAIVNQIIDIQVTGLEEGNNEIWALALDKAGNQSIKSNIISVHHSIIAGMHFPEAFREPGVFRVITSTVADKVEIDIFTIDGEKVTTLTDLSPSSDFSIPWDLTNGNGEEVLNGVFLCVITIAYGGKETVEKDFIAVVK
jgi:hypothetical protein